MKKVLGRGQEDPRSLLVLRNVGRACLADFEVLEITTVSQLAGAEPDALYARLCLLTGKRHDPCVHDVFAAAVHQARTGEARDWWQFTAARKVAQASGRFPVVGQQGQHRPYKQLLKSLQDKM